MRHKTKNYSKARTKVIARFQSWIFFFFLILGELLKNIVLFFYHTTMRISNNYICIYHLPLEQPSFPPQN